MQIKHRRNKTSKFIPKLHKILSEPQSGACWRKDEKSFIIYDISEFIANSLPKHFRHSNISSFIRQLNLYGFKKIVGQDVVQNTYFHEKFKKDYITELKPIRSFYNQQKFGKAKKSKKTRNEPINHETKQQNQELNCLLGSRPITMSSVGISQKQKNDVLEKEVQRLKGVQQEYIKLLDFLSKTQGWSNPFGIYIPQSQENLFGMNWDAKASLESYVSSQESNLICFQGQTINNSEGVSIYQHPAYYFPFLGTQ